MRRPVRAFAPVAAPALVLALLLFAGPAAAQAPLQAETCRPPVLSIEQPSGAFAPGSQSSLLFAVENGNGPPVDAVRASITTTTPAGWTAIPAQRELTLGPENVSITALTITAPNRGSGASAGNVTVHVAFVCSSGEIQTVSAASTTLEVEIAEFRAPWPVVLGAFGVLAVGVTILGLRRLRRGIAIVPLGAERKVVPGKSAKFTFVVENRRGRPQRFHLLGVGVPEGWSLHLALDVVELEPGEEKTLWAILKAPASAQPGADVAITLRLEGARGARGATAASATLHALVVSD